MGESEAGGVPTGSGDWAAGLEHAWRYFELHAKQRMTILNYFLLVSTLIFAAIGAALQGPPRLAGLGIVLGLLLALTAAVFRNLDARTSMLIKAAEGALAEAEAATLPAPTRVFSSERARVRDRGFLKGVWSYGTSLRLGFAVMIFLGLCSSALSVLRLAGMFGWEQGVS